jgi:hypothetical protein
VNATIRKPAKIRRMGRAQRHPSRVTPRRRHGFRETGVQIGLRFCRFGQEELRGLQDVQVGTFRHIGEYDAFSHLHASAWPDQSQGVSLVRLVALGETARVYQVVALIHRLFHREHTG